MSEENSAISVTLKAGPGYEAPWINVRGDSPEEVAARVASVANSGLTDTVALAAVGFQGTYAAGKGLGAQPVAEMGQFPPAPPVTAPAPNVVQFPQAQAAPVDQYVVGQQTVPAAASVAQGLPAGSATDKWGNVYSYNVPGAPQCPHGTRILKQGKKKDGTPYSSYICPQVDNFFRVQTDCKPVYI